MCTFHTSIRIKNGHGLYFYLRTSRLDLDDYNKEVEEGCHITLWLEPDELLKVLEECGVKNDTLNFFSENP
jgi:maltose phosphorylase